MIVIPDLFGNLLLVWLYDMLDEAKVCIKLK